MEALQGGAPSRAPQRSQDLPKLIRKLRWIGMEEEAHRLETALASIPRDERSTVAAEPSSTD